MSIKFFSTYINHLLSRSMISDLGGKMPRILFGKRHKLFRAELFSKEGIALEWEYFGKTFIHFWRKYFLRSGLISVGKHARGRPRMNMRVICARVG